MIFRNINKTTASNQQGAINIEYEKRYVKKETNAYFVNKITVVVMNLHKQSYFG